MRGYQKRVIYLKNTGSQSFEEAYFVLRSDTSSTVASSQLMIDEANKIIEENFGGGRGIRRERRKGYIFSFLMGCALTLTLSLLFYFISR